MEYYVAQHHLSSGSWSPAMDQCSLLCTEPGPCSVIQHIFTCSWKHHWYISTLEFTVSFSFDIVILFLCLRVLHYRNKGLFYRWGKYNGRWLRWPAVNGELRHGVSLDRTHYLFASTVLIYMLLFCVTDLYSSSPMCSLFILSRKLKFTVAAHICSAICFSLMRFFVFVHALKRKWNQIKLV
jgi:hypothetical protein